MQQILINKLMNLPSTAYGPAQMRAMGNLLPEHKRLFEDPYSEILLPPFWKLFVILARFPIILNSMIKMRERSSPKEGVETVVNLGVGMGTHAFRISGIENIKYFELDFHELQKVKRSYINKKIGELPSNIPLVPIDFRSQDLGEELKK